MTKEILFPALTKPLPRIFLRKTPSITEAHAIVAHGVSAFLTQGTSTFISEPENFPNKAPRMILDNCTLLSFISVDILSAKALF